MRTTEIDLFLRDAGWENASIAPLAGDASRRRYMRVTDPRTNTRAVLMDAPPETGETLAPFVTMARYLRSVGMSAPDVLATDTEHGFLLLEDLGDDLFARVAERQPDVETTLYETATDLLVHVHGIPPSVTLARYDGPAMSEQSALILDWYVTAINGAVSSDAVTEFRGKIAELVTRHAEECDVLTQRDYHSENLLWLPNRKGLERVGLLDFQDATFGHRAYDLVSLLQDARRDVSADLEATMKNRYRKANSEERDAFDAAYAVIGAQRSLRIIGVFARLCLRDGKQGYVDLIPRVWGQLQRNLSHPELQALGLHLSKVLPPPSSEALAILRSKCATSLMPS